MVLLRSNLNSFFSILAVKIILELRGEIDNPAKAAPNVFLIVYKISM
jgi:hypothetical protein